MRKKWRNTRCTAARVAHVARLGGGAYPTIDAVSGTAMTPAKLPIVFERDWKSPASSGLRQRHHPSSDKHASRVQNQAPRVVLA